MPDLRLVPTAELDRIRAADVDADAKLALLADACRLNALVAVKRAGSGHLGSTFSALDIVAQLLFDELDVVERGFDDPDRDVFFSSKGHDVPGLYAALFALGAVPRERLLRLRRLGGLDGHPDIGVPGIEASSGSLGMGISKGRGIALAKRRLGREGLVVVMTGDGELQEGQNWEALQAAAHERLGRLWVVVDRNEVQSDKPTEEIVALGDLEAKLRAFGWDVETVDGHDHAALRAAFARFRAGGDAPKALVAQTVKGKGVSFMEHPVALAEGGGTYRWHAGAPADEPFARAVSELETRIAERCAARGLDSPVLEPVETEAPAAGLEGEPESGAGSRTTAKPSLRDAAEYVVEAYGETLLELGAERDDLVVLDADLASDCRTRAFELAYPDSFFQCGIAEQDMVSTAAGMARHGLLPVVNSFASFLASRANEQIYNQASEGSKVVYALHYAGLVPAGPGKSHQSIRDISLLGALPNVTIVQPGSWDETRGLLRWAVDEADETVAVRLAIGPSPRRIELPTPPVVGQGNAVRDGDDAVVVAYGPVMLHEALLAAEGLAESGKLSLRVVAMPWLNRFDADWLAAEVAPFEHLFVLEDHAPVGGLGDSLRAALPGRVVTVFGVEGWPACGTPEEALRFHGLDGESLAARIAAVAGRDAERAASAAR
jgi:transketolase